MNEPYNYTIAEGKVYYSLDDKEKPDYGLFKMNIDGTDKKKINAAPLDVRLKSVGSSILTDYDNQSSMLFNIATEATTKMEFESPYNKPQLRVVPNGNSRYFTKTIDSFAQIVRVNSDGTNEKQLTKGANVSGGFYVTPNGAYVVFYGSVGTEAGVFILPSNGGAPVKVASAHISESLTPR